MIKLYGRKTSFNVQKVLWFLEELNLDFSLVELGGRFGGLDDPEFSKLNPMKKVPVLVDGDKVIWESHSILRYLASEYGEMQTPYQRSEYERWMDWSQVIFQPAFMGTFWGFYRMPESKRDMSQIDRDLSTCVSALNLVESTLQRSSLESSNPESPVLVGAKLSLADVCVGAILYRLTEQGLDIKLPPRVNEWYQVLKQRVGYQKWIMSDFTELKAREDY